MGDLNLIRLLHLVSPSLPTGAYSYSQGLEWAVEAGWVNSDDELAAWLTDLLENSLARVDLPLLLRMQTACRQEDEQSLSRWCRLLLACRETDELRMEEMNRGRALLSLLRELDIDHARHWPHLLASCQVAGFACAAAHWRIPATQAAAGYGWAWLENQVVAGIKIIPLGQSQGQRILLRLGHLVTTAVDRAAALPEEEIGASCQALALASSLHEDQYTRLYRS
ncbi:urease accessory protein UreF [Thermodesulfobacteriota bacterium B35]